MEENIIGFIAEAEMAAAEKKAQAQAEAAEIVAAAEKHAAEIAKSSEAECARLREETVKTAEENARLAYDKAIATAHAEATEYADGLLKNASSHVFDIVGRLTK